MKLWLGKVVVQKIKTAVSSCKRKLTIKMKPAERYKIDYMVPGEFYPGLINLFDQYWVLMERKLILTGVGIFVVERILFFPAIQ